MSKQEQKQQRIYDLLNAETNRKFFFVYHIQSKENIFTGKRGFQGKRGVENLTKTKRMLFNCSRYGD